MVHVWRALLTYVVGFGLVYLAKAFIDWDLNWLADVAEWRDFERVGFLLALLLIMPITSWVVVVWHLETREN